MKRLFVAGVTLVLLVAAVAVSGIPQQQSASSPLTIDIENRNPWTNLRLNDDPANFSFAIVSDRTGGHRARVFSQAVHKINLLQPSFVVSVGDLIEGYTEDMKQVGKEWNEFQSYACQLDMPFFYCVGNHDITNPMMEKIWQDRFGRRYYHFVYRNVLFLMLNSEDPPADKETNIGVEQIKWVKATLAKYPKVRWTFVFLHKPLWHYSNPGGNGWLKVEKELAGRKYTVFAGHLHRYRKFIRNGMDYYQLATTGGISRMRGVEYKEFDHIVWVTMKDKPVLANVMLNGIYPENLKPTITAEKGFTYPRKETYPVKGVLYAKGTPCANARIYFHLLDQGRFYPSNAIVSAAGGFVPSTYTANDGLPAGDYAVTVEWRQPFFKSNGEPGRSLLPEKYADKDTTPVRVTIKKGENVLNIDLKDD